MPKVKERSAVVVDPKVATAAAATSVEEAGAKAARIGLWLGPLLFFLMLLLPAPAGMSVEAQRVAAVALLIATWWMTEALPLPATSLLPIVLFPLLGVMTTANATAPYANHVIFLYIGGFMIALAMQRWGLHKRIALSVVEVVGTAPRQMVLGFMLSTGFISAWLSNTATVMMMLPIGLAILVLLEGEERGPLGAALMLGIAYAASIGGVATLIGTPPNAIFAAAASEIVGRKVGFGQWMLVGVPIAVILLFVSWFVLVHLLFRLPAGSAQDDAAREAVRSQRAALGRMLPGERVVATVFVLTALLWIVLDPKQIGDLEIPGLTTWMPMITDSSIAIAGALVLFMFPAKLEGQRTFVLDWEWASKIPWGVLLLFGGGLSLARGFETSGLAAWIGDQVTNFSALPPIALGFVVAALFVFLSELTSNTAIATMGMPVMAGVAAGVGADPLVLMAVATLGSSLAFMMPAGTPPNAIVFGTGRVSIGQMARAGFWLNLISILLVTLFAPLISRVFGGS